MYTSFLTLVTRALGETCVSTTALQPARRLCSTRHIKRELFVKTSINFCALFKKPENDRHIFPRP